MAQNQNEFIDAAFSSSLDGAASATGKLLESGLASGIEFGEQLLSNALTEVERNARLSNMQDFVTYKVNLNLAAEFEAKAVEIATTNSRKAELWTSFANVYKRLAVESEVRLIQAAQTATSESYLSAVAAATKLLTPTVVNAIGKTVGSASGLAMSVYKINDIIEKAEQNGMPDSQVELLLEKEILGAGVLTASAFTKSVISYISSGKSIQMLVGRAGLIGAALSASFEFGWIIGKQLNSIDWFSEGAAKFLEPIFDLFTGKTTVGELISSSFILAQRVRPPVGGGGVDPLTLDLDGDGIENHAFNLQRPIYFDHDLNGSAEGTGWIGSDDAFLVLDRNGNGKIDNGSELFGDHTPLASGGFAADGFAALAQEDTNGDGLVNSGDASFSKLRIWRDLNQDGVSQAEELFALKDVGISAIHVAKTEHSQLLANGNQIADLGTFIWSDGHEGTAAVTGNLADIDFAIDTFHSTFPDKLPLAEGVEDLPDMQGSGLVRSLKEAASQSEVLKNLTAQFSSATTRAEQMNLVDQLLLAWADTSGLAKSLDDRDPAQYRIRYTGFGDITRASHVVGNEHPDARDGENTDIDDSYRALISSWTNRIHVLEAFNGRYFFLLPGQTQAGLSTATGLNTVGKNTDGTTTLNVAFMQQQLSSLENSYQSLRDSVYTSLAMQTRLAGLLGQVEIVSTPEKTGIDCSGLLGTLQGRISANPAEGIGDFLTFMRYAPWLKEDARWSVDSLRTLQTTVDQHYQNPDVQKVLAECHVRSSNIGTLSGTADNDIILGDVSNNSIYAGAGDDAVSGGGGDDTLYGGLGSNTLLGGAGNDHLYAYDSHAPSQGSANVLEGGTGNDVLNGGGGSDTYRFNLGDGQDTIVETYLYQGSGTVDTATDKIVLGAGIAPSDVTVSRSGYDLQLNFAHAGDQIRIANWYAGASNRIEQLIFADGTVWDREKLHAGGLVINGTAGVDNLTGLQDEQNVLLGGAGNDTLSAAPPSNGYLQRQGSANVLEGGTGNDVLNGGGGSDTYRFNLGDGQDTIVETYLYQGSGTVDTVTDKIVLGAGIAPSDVTVSRSGYDLQLNFAHAGDQIRIANWYAGASNRIEQLIFADGTVWDREKLHAGGLVINGTAGVDNLTGLQDEQNVLLGGAGNDTLSAAPPSNGYLQRQGSANVLEGGTGNDVLNGGGGSDTYRFNLGDGQDTIVETYLYQGSGTVDTVTDKIVLGAGIAPSDVTVSRSGYDLQLNFAHAGDQIRIANWYAGASNRIEQLIFADGTVWDREKLHAGGLVINGTAGVDNLTGLQDEQNVLLGGAGNDTLSAAPPSNGYLQRQGSANVLEGGTGNDVLNGGGGSDTYRFNLGDGQDTIVETYLYQGSGTVDTVTDKIVLGAGIAPSDVTVSRSGYDLQLNFAHAGDQIRIANWYAGASNRIEQLIFADGTVWDREKLHAGGLVINGTAGVDNLTGLQDEQNVLLGGAGNDTLSAAPPSNGYLQRQGSANVLEGGTGNDVLNGGGGSDTYRFNLGDGQDTIVETYLYQGSGTVDTVTDKIVLGAGIAPSDVTVSRSGYDLQLNFAHAGDQIRIANWYAGASNRIEQLIFADGTVWDREKLHAGGLVINGTAEADNLVGMATEGDVIDGLGGNDTLSGGTGNDIYLFGIGSGQDTINENDSTAGNTDTIRLKAGVLPSQITLMRDSNTLILSINGTSDKITVANWSSGSSYRIERIEFLDGPDGTVGTVWDNTVLSQIPVLGTAGAETLYGAVDADHIESYGGNDTIYAQGGDDWIDGGEGNDQLSGGTGNDIYLFGIGSGQDTINENDSTAGNTDTIRLKAGVLPSQITLMRDSNALILSINGTSDKITVANWSSGSSYRIERIEFLDGPNGTVGTVWDNTVLSQIPVLGTAGAEALYGAVDADHIESYGGNDTIYAQGGDDWIDGGEGNDQLSGGTGNDIYLFGIGSGQDTINENDSTAGNVDTIRLKAGVLPSQITLMRDSNALILSINGTSDKITVANWSSGSSYRIERIEFLDGPNGTVGTVWDNTVLSQIPVLGTAGAEALYGAVDADHIESYGGNDTIYAQGGDDWIDGGEGNDQLSGGTGNDIYLFGIGSGQDTINENDSTAGNVDTIRLKAGVLPSQITLMRDSNALILSINGTSDKITVSNWSSGSPYRIERIEFLDGPDGSVGTVWDNTVLSQIPVLGTAGAETLYGAVDADHIESYGGNDTIYAQGGDDWIDGGEGNDQLSGGTGNDIYLFGIGSGQDTINENDSTAGNTDTIRLKAGVLPSQITLMRDSNALILSINGTSDKITVANWSSGSSYRIERIEFLDGPNGTVGTVWDNTVLSQIPVLGTAGAEALYGAVDADHIESYGGNDTIYAQGGDDWIDGGEGNDQLSGGTGNDIYLFGIGSGQDTINENDATQGNIDTIRIEAGVLPSGVTLKKTSSSLILAITGTTDTITVANWAAGSPYRIERIEFLDGPNGTVGTVWDSSVLDQVPEPPAQDTPVTIWGTSNSENIYGTSGNDVIDASSGNDTIYGGSGSYGYGNDTYIFGEGSGQDIVNDYDSTAGNLDTIRVVGKLPSEVTLSRGISGSSVTNDLLISINGTTDKLTVQNYFAGSQYKIEKVQFDNGTVWGAAELDVAAAIPTTTAAIYGTSNNDTYDLRNAANSVITDSASYGGNGNDTYIFGAGSGQDTIMDYSNNSSNLDTIKVVGKLPSEVTLSRRIDSYGYATDDLVVSINGTTDKLIVQNYFQSGNYYKIEKVQFDNGTVWGTTELDVAAVTPTTANSSVIGTAGNDTYDLKNAASNTIYESSGYGGNGNDTYLFGAGSGQDMITDYSTNSSNLDTIKVVGKLPSEVMLSRRIDSYGYATNDLMISINGTTDTLTVQNYFAGSQYKIEKVQFDNGTVWGTTELDVAAVTPTTANSSVIGTAGNDTYDLKNAASNTIYESSGYGGNGNDTYLFGAGSGQDMITDYSTNSSNLDTIKVVGKLPSEVMLSRRIDSYGYATNDLMISINGTTDTLTVQNYFAGSQYKIEKVQFDNGTVWGTTELDVAAVTPTTANSSVIGTAGNDTYDLKNAASNTIYESSGYGGNGNDTYLFGAGSGQDTILDYSTNSSNLDIAKFTAGVADDQIWFRHVDNNLEVSLIGTSDKLTIQNWYSGSTYHLEQFKTADNKVLLDTQVENLVQAMAAFAPPAAGQTTLPQNYQDTLAPVIAANWQ